MIESGERMKQFDLHMHSCYSSDGELTPKQLIEQAEQAGLQLVALSDHDCVLGIDAMRQAGIKAGIEVIPAVEFTTLFDEDIECHLLGYGFDYKQPYFQMLHETTQQKMQAAFHQRVQKLEAVYPVHIDEQQILRDAQGENPWFLLCERMFQAPENAGIEDFAPYRKGGSRDDPAPVNFFWDKCQKGSPLHVHVDYPAFAETVRIIHEAGGLAILAHPFQTFYEREDRLEKAIICGIDGLEAYSNYHEPKHNAYYARYAKEHALLITCGSDFHGKHKPSIMMGCYGKVDHKEDILRQFLHALEARKAFLAK